MKAEDSFIGKSISRVDGPLKVRGRAPYTADVALPNLAHAFLLKSRIGRGRITQIDTSVAKAASGVIEIFDHRSGFPFKLPQATVREGTILSEDFLPMQNDEILYYGQTIGVVVAETFEEARFAANLVKVTYEEQLPETSLEKGPAIPAKQVDGEPAHATYLAEGVVSLETILPAADIVIKGTYTTPWEHHCTIELHATTAVWENDQLTVYNPSQSMNGQQTQLSQVLDVPKERIRVISQFVGGAFGSKAKLWMHTAIVARVAERLRRPVKLVLTREQSFHSVGHRAATRQELTLGAKRDGTLIALRHAVKSSSSLASPFTESAAHRTSRVMYACPNIEVNQEIVPLNLGAPCWMRGPGETPGMFALESAMDELAVELKMDPVELRLKNYADTHPADKHPFSAKYLRECYALGREKFGWSARSNEVRSTQNGDWLIGRGMASAMYPGHRLKSSARVRIRADGSVIVSTATHDLGTGMYTLLTQIVAEAVGVPLSDVEAELGDTRLPPAAQAGGSMSTASVLPAVHAAAISARKKLLAAAVSPDSGAPFASRNPEELTIEEGQIVAGDRRETIASLLKRRGIPAIEATETTEPGEEAKKLAFFSFGAHFVELKVHALTCEVRVLRVTSVMNVGRVMNAKTARSQIMGGIIMGLGMALMEESLVDSRTGRWMTSDLGLYHFPVNMDVPEIDIHFIDNPDTAFNPLGARGAGEIGTTGVAAAVANAVYNATGKRIRDLPITLDKLIV